jgi:hypothetical protein
MTQPLILHPFRIGPNGSVVTAEDGTDALYGAELSMLLQTQPGERPSAPLYGINDPTFDEFTEASLVQAVATFGPPVIISSAVSEWVDPETMDVTVTFTAGTQADNTDNNLQDYEMGDPSA